MESTEPELAVQPPDSGGPTAKPCTCAPELRDAFGTCSESCRLTDRTDTPPDPALDGSGLPIGNESELPDRSRLRMNLDRYANANAELHGDIAELRRELAQTIVKRDEWRAKALGYEQALYDIARMNREPRPDGTFNYCREAIIDTARRALGDDHV